MAIRTVEEAKKFVDNYMNEIKSKGYQPNIVDINNCMEELRNQGFYTLVDNTNKIIDNIMFDGRGNLDYKILGEIRT